METTEILKAIEWARLFLKQPHLIDKKELKKSLQKVYESLSEKFPNGFESWKETHFEVVTHLTRSADFSGSLANKRREQQGIGGLYELADELTHEFESANVGRNWDGEFFDEIEEFLKNKERLGK